MLPMALFEAIGTVRRRAAAAGLAFERRQRAEVHRRRWVCAARTNFLQRLLRVDDPVVELLRQGKTAARGRAPAS